MKLDRPLQYKKLYGVRKIWITRIICRVKTPYHQLTLSVLYFSQIMVNQSMNCLGVGILFSKVVHSYYLVDEEFPFKVHVVRHWIFSRVLCDSTPRFFGPSVHPQVRRSVTLYFFLGFCGLWPHCSCPNDLVISIKWFLVKLDHFKSF